MSGASPGDALSVDLIVPTFRRPVLLDRCLNSVAAQARSPARVLVVAREDDRAAHGVLDAYRQRLPRLEVVTVAEPGVLAAMAAGVACSTGDVLAFTDDDAAPRPDWLAGLLRHFEDPAVGAVGGRDVIAGQEAPLTDRVGCFERTGRMHGNHHLGTGPPRDVDVLKGVNMAFRAAALALPAPGVLRGAGAQVDFEVLCCGFARRQGWRVVYDPAVLVDHEGAPRQGADRRLRPARSAIFDAAFNSVVAGSGLEPRKIVQRAGFGIAVGTRDRPGLGRALVALRRREHEVLRRSGPALAGRASALFWLLDRRLRRRAQLVVTARELRAVTRARPRVLLVAHDIHDGGGMERACAELVRHLHRDFDITVVSATLAEDLRSLVRWRRVNVPRRPFVVKFLAFFVRAGRTVRSTETDLVHTLGAIIPNRTDVASVHFCHAGYRIANRGLAPVGASRWRRLNTSSARLAALVAERWCYRPSRVRTLAAVSEGVGSEVTSHYPGVAVALTPNGVDGGRFYPRPGQRQAIRVDLGLESDQCVALFVGGDWDRKGLALAVEALATARTREPNLVLLVVGPGDRQRFAALADRFGVSDHVRFFGRRADTERFYRAADLFVLPSAYETFSVVCFEAAACGLPLVVPQLSGAGDLVGAAEAGIIVERNVESVASALEELVRDPALRARMGAAARRRAQAFTWDASAASVAVAYRSLLTDA